jgi:hypothetical protein
MHQVAVKSAIKILRAKIAQKIHIIEKCKFLGDTLILNCTNKAFSRE